jgi:hypothetical protein
MRPYVYALFKATLSLIILSMTCGIIVLSAILVPSEGTEPRDICILVEGTQGLLPINPNEGGSIVYSCDINWDLALFYIAVFGFPLGLVSFGVLFMVRTLVHRRF